jgi:hypothetical protein
VEAAGALLIPPGADRRRRLDRVKARRGPQAAKAAVPPSPEDVGDLRVRRPVDGRPAQGRRREDRVARDHHHVGQHRRQLRPRPDAGGARELRRHARRPHERHGGSP